MISLFQAIIALVLLGLGSLIYFIYRKSPKDDDIDPLENVIAKPVEPAQTKPVVADEPDTNEEPEIVVVIPKPEPENEDEPVKPTPTTTPAQPLVPAKTKPAPALKPAPTPKPAPEPEEETEQPTPTTTPAKPIVPTRPVIQPPVQQSISVIGVRGKFASEGGYDLNNKTDVMTFPRASSADIHIEHVDVHRGDPANRNASIIFKYQGGTVHKFTFVGNGGLRFKKQDGSFGPNLGVGDVSSVVLTDMGLPTNSYKIECTRTAGRNTWHFKPLDLSKGLVGIDLSDNADWGGLRGLYIDVKAVA